MQKPLRRGIQTKWHATRVAIGLNDDEGDARLKESGQMDTKRVHSARPRVAPEQHLRSGAALG